MELCIHRGHRNKSTLIRIPTDHMRFVPTHRQSDDTTATLPPAKWPVEMVLLSNETGREQYLYQPMIHKITALAIQDVCQMTPELTKFFPRTNTNSQGALSHHGRHPTRPIPRCPANNTTTWPPAPITPPRGHYPGVSSGYVPNLGQIGPHRLFRIPLRVVELCGGLTTGLEVLLRSSYVIRSSAWVDTNQDAHTAASERIAHLSREF